MLYSDILETGFISYKVNPKDIDTKSEDFIELSIEDKKKLLMELLDKINFTLIIAILTTKHTKYQKKTKLLQKAFMRGYKRCRSFMKR